MALFKIYINLFIVGLAFFSASAQNLPPGQYSSSNRKAIKQLEEARAAFEMKKDVLAEKGFLRALELDKNFIEAALGLANLYQVTNRHEEAIFYFKRAIEINPKF